MIAARLGEPLVRLIAEPTADGLGSISPVDATRPYRTSALAVPREASGKTFEEQRKAELSTDSRCRT